MELVEIGKNPISPDKPAGEDVKYEPEFEALQAEIEKYTTPGAASPVNWATVENMASGILAEKAKDLLTASYLATALLQNKKIDGLVDGINLLKDMTATFWEDLYPPKKRMRGRKNAIAWFFEQAEIYFQNNEPAPMPQEKHQALKDVLDELASFLGENMEEPPSSRALMNIISMIPVQAAAPPPAPAAEAAPAAGAATPSSAPAPAAAPAAAAAEGPADIQSPQDAVKVLNGAFQKFKQVANYYIENDMANPMAYVLTRMAAWLPIQNLPPASDGNTKIPPPQAQFKTTLDNLYANADWENLMKAAEGRVNQFLFWLDLSRLVAESHDNMGDKFSQARNAVVSETVSFVKRLKGLENLAFSDGTPFADNETKKWLKENMQAEGDGGGFVPEGAPSGDSEESKISEEFEQALTLVKEKKLNEAVYSLQEKMNSCSSAKSRMLWRMSLARLLLKVKKPKPVMPHLEQMFLDIEAYHLDEWDPTLAVQGYKVILEGLEGQKDEESKAKIRKALDKIAKLSPVEALAFDKLM